MVMFTGEFRHNLDARNRLMIPAKYRDRIHSTLYITEWHDGCLAAYVEEDWLKMVEGLYELPKTNKDARDYVRFIMGKADECDIDNAGRILLQQFQINDVGIKKSVVISGAGDHFEIWPEELFDSYNPGIKQNLGTISQRVDGLTK